MLKVDPKTKQSNSVQKPELAMSKNNSVNKNDRQADTTAQSILQNLAKSNTLQNQIEFQNNLQANLNSNNPFLLFNNNFQNGRRGSNDA